MVIVYGQEEEEEEEEEESICICDESSGHRHASHVSTERINCGLRPHTHEQGLRRVG